MEDDEVVMGDKGYQGADGCLTPYKGQAHRLSPSELALNEVIASARQIVECVFARMKNFQVLNDRFRCTLDKHKPVFNVVAHVTNIGMRRAPVFLRKNYYM